MAKTVNIGGGDISLEPDAEVVSSSIVTTHGTPGTDTSIDIPDTARGFILEPTGSLVRWNVNAAAEAVGTGTDFNLGGRAKADTEIVRLLPTGTGRTLHLRSLVASVNCYVEWWG